jgi:ribokinase
MRVFNFGSLNIDRVYSIDHFVRPGETLTSALYSEFAGGKGLNQSIALARAGANVCHIGKIGKDGIFLREILAENGIDVTNIFMANGPTGHAIIQVDKSAENAILLYGGANQSITTDEIKLALNRSTEEDWLLLQNEISRIEEIMRYAADRGLKIVFNPAPMTPEVHSFPLDIVNWLIVNELEGEAITGQKAPEKILDEVVTRYPDMSVILTLGIDGVHFADRSQRHYIPAEAVTPVDTTGAGDTFIGYFFAETAKGRSVKKSMETANRAAAICVTRPGAADSIPHRNELNQYLA